MSQFIPIGRRYKDSYNLYTVEGNDYPTFFWQGGWSRPISRRPRYSVGDKVQDKKGNEYTVTQLLVYQFRSHEPDPWYELDGNKIKADHDLW